MTDKTMAKKKKDKRTNYTRRNTIYIETLVQVQFIQDCH